MKRNNSSIIRLSSAFFTYPVVYQVPPLNPIFQSVIMDDIEDFKNRQDNIKEDRSHDRVNHGKHIGAQHDKGEGQSNDQVRKPFMLHEPDLSQMICPDALPVLLLCRSKQFLHPAFMCQQIFIHGSPSLTQVLFFRFMLRIISFVALSI